MAIKKEHPTKVTVELSSEAAERLRAWSTANWQEPGDVVELWIWDNISDDDLAAAIASHRSGGRV